MFRRSLLRSSLTYFCLLALVASSAPLTRAGSNIAASTSIVVMSSVEANAALAQGRNLFSNGQDDQAFVQLDAALKGFTAANDFAGSAAAEDALGDIYTRTGQYVEALKHYAAARDLFQKANNTDNVSATLAKIGETNFLIGDHAAARAAFAAMNVVTPAQAAQNAEAQSKNGKPAGGMMPAMSGIAAVCAAPQGSNAPNNGNDPSNPPNMGRAPARLDGIGRLHTQVLDEAGNPMKGVNLDLKSKRPDGFRCNCVNSTDLFGYSVLPPLHIGEIKLVLKAPGMPTQELPLKLEDLKEIVRVQLTRNGAQLVKQAAQNSMQSAGAASCFNMYRAFSLFGTSRLGQGRADYESGNLAAAKASYEDLLKQLNLPGAETLSMTPRFRAAALTALGDIALKEKRFDDAAKLYTEARDGAKLANRLDLMWAAQRGIGQVLWQQTQAATDSQIAAKLRSETAVAYREAIKTIEQIRQNSMRADEARTTFLASTKDVYDEAAEVITELALVAAGLPMTTTEAKPATVLNGYALTLAAESFKISEQARARSLLDMLAESRTRITADVPPAIAKRKSEITARQSEIVRILTGASLPADRATATVPVLEAELARLSGEAEALENQIRTGNARYANLTAGRPLTLAEVQQQVLDDQTALLAFSLGKTASTVWAVTREGVAVGRLPGRESIEAEAMKLRAQLIPEGLRRSIVGIDVALANNPEAKENSSSNASDPASFALVAHTLYNMTVAPVASLVGNKRILVVADGALNYVPFEALVTVMPTDAANSDYSSLSYLIKTNEVMYTPSASVVAALRAQRAATSNAKGSVLVVADPVFSLEDARVKSAANAAKSATADTTSRTRGLLLSSALADVSKNLASNMHLVRLNGTRTEANEIATLARTAGSTAEVWLDFDASEQNVLARNMKDYRVLHFATHGILNAERPQFTGLAFSLVGEQGNDGFLRVNEVFNFKLGQPLVMLSACETGLGKEKRGEGVIGLTRAFMYAGAPTVGVSLWSVSDRSTARLMGDFYKELFANNATPGTALRTAQVAMINNPRYSAPFFWAPFVLVGDWR
ncbi:MAG: CHAT domain-containing protein [Pyrinomonadaceae bacterium MAG19_C2-C3]|nr:CHAT domain-containing protein [Pyrinomonadaceae bacterium MAG19_C2-C3]